MAEALLPPVAAMVGQVAVAPPATSLVVAIPGPGADYCGEQTLEMAPRLPLVRTSDT